MSEKIRLSPNERPHPVSDLLQSQKEIISPLDTIVDLDKPIVSAPITSETSIRAASEEDYKEDDSKIKEALQQPIVELNEMQREALHQRITEYIDIEAETQLLLRSLAQEHIKFYGARNPHISREEIIKSRPKWQEHFPKTGGADDVRAWMEFCNQFPSVMATKLESLRLASRALDRYNLDEQLVAATKHEKFENLEMLRDVSAVRYWERQIRVHTELIDAQMRSHDVSGLPLNDIELSVIQEHQMQIEEAHRARAQIMKSTVEEGRIQQFAHEMSRREQLVKHREFKAGLVWNDQMEDIREAHLSSLASGIPLLLKGEAGGAKTSLAKRLAHEVTMLTGKAKTSSEREQEHRAKHTSREYEFLAGHRDFTAYEMLGKYELRGEEGATITEFFPGPLARAMEEGKPIIIDEVNAIPAGFLKILNEILLKRPGDSFTIQTNNGKTFPIAEGFCIICTMNEKSERYKGVDDLSMEFKNRFTANEVRVQYPDADLDVGSEDLPLNNYQLALLALTNDYGEFMSEETGQFLLAGDRMTPKELESFVRVAHYTQRMFSEPAARFNTFGNVTDSLSEGKKGLQDFVISPRSMVSIIEKVKHGRTLKDVLIDEARAIANARDKGIFAELLFMYNLIDETEAVQINPALASSNEATG